MAAVELPDGSRGPRRQGTTQVHLLYVIDEIYTNKYKDSSRREGSAVKVQTGLGISD